MGIRLGDTAPDITATTTEGDVNFHNWLDNQWAVLLSHPNPICSHLANLYFYV